METKQVALSEIVFDNDLYPRKEHDPERVQKYAECLKMQSVTNGTIFFCPDIGCIIGKIEDGIFHYRNHLGLEIFKRFLSTVKHEWETSTNTEKEMVNNVARTLSRSGWKVTTERQTPCGRIDIFAEKDDAEIIIEAKLGNDAGAISTALGQILIRSVFFPEALLFLCTPEVPRRALLNIIESYGITHLEADNVRI